MPVYNTDGKLIRHDRVRSSRRPTDGLDPTYIIRRPVLTEKSTEAMNEDGAYTFDVDRRATKDDIRRAVEAIYGVKVVDVRTKPVRGRTRRMKYGYVESATGKHAMVRLEGDQSIELF